MFAITNTAIFPCSQHMQTDFVYGHVYGSKYFHCLIVWYLLFDLISSFLLMCKIISTSIMNNQTDNHVAFLARIVYPFLSEKLSFSMLLLEKEIVALDFDHFCNCQP